MFASNQAYASPFAAADPIAPVLPTEVPKQPTEAALASVKTYRPSRQVKAARNARQAKASAPKGRGARSAITIQVPEDLADKIRTAAFTDGPKRGTKGLSGYLVDVLAEHITKVERNYGQLPPTEKGVLSSGWSAHSN